MNQPNNKNLIILHSFADITVALRLVSNSSSNFSSTEIIFEIKISKKLSAHAAQHSDIG